MNGRLGHWAVTHVALALAMGGAGAWAIIGRFSVGRAALFCALWLGALTFTVQRGHTRWIWLAVPLAVPVGWIAATATADWAVVVLFAAVVVAVFPGRNAEYTERQCGLRRLPEETSVSGQVHTFVCRLGSIPSNCPVVAVWIAYGVVVAATALGVIPIWTILVMLSVPWAAGRNGGFGIEVWRCWLMAFEGQLVLALLIEGMVR